MKYLITCLSALVFLAASCAAQTASGPSADVAPNAWSFAAEDTLEKAGIILGYPNGTYTGRRAVTRYEFAVATARILKQAKPLTPDGWPGLATDVFLKLKASPLAVSASIALVGEFRPELSKSGQDIPEATARLEAIRRQQRRDIHDGRGVLTPDQLQNPFADIPFGDAERQKVWRYASIIQKTGVVVGMTDGDFSGGLPSLTRLQMGASLAHVLAAHPQSPEVVSRLQSEPDGLAALVALVAEFAPELKLLGLSPDFCHERLAEMGRSALHPLPAKVFSDVPPDSLGGLCGGDSTETLFSSGLSRRQVEFVELGFLGVGRTRHQSDAQPPQLALQRGSPYLLHLNVYF